MRVREFFCVIIVSIVIINLCFYIILYRYAWQEHMEDAPLSTPIMESGDEPSVYTPMRIVRNQVNINIVTPEETLSRETNNQM